MNWMTRESFEKTQASYTKAISRLFELCPNLEMSCNDSNARSVFPHNLESAWGGKDLKRHVTHVSAWHEGLFDYGRPKIIEQRTWLYRDSFFKVHLEIRVPFTIFMWEPGLCGRDAYADDEGEFHPEIVGYPAAIKPWSEQYISLDLKVRSWGIADFRNKSEAVKSFCDDCPQGVRDFYLDAFANAQAELDKWSEAIKSLANLTI